MAPVGLLSSARVLLANASMPFGRVDPKSAAYLKRAFAGDPENRRRPSRSGYPGEASSRHLGPNRT